MEVNYNFINLKLEPIIKIAEYIQTRFSVGKEYSECFLLVLYIDGMTEFMRKE